MRDVGDCELNLAMTSAPSPEQHQARRKDATKSKKTPGKAKRQQEERKNRNYQREMVEGWRGAVVLLSALTVVLVAAYLRTSDSASCEALRSLSLERVVVIGDVHGDAEALKEVLEAAGVADGDCNWRGNTTIVVQMGDVVDRGPDAAGANACLAKIQSRSRAVGGAVRLAGNHELLQASGNYRYASKSETRAVMDKAVDQWLKDVQTGDVRAAYVLGPLLFSHAGFRPAMLEKVNTEGALEAEALASRLADFVNAELRRTVDDCLRRPKTTTPRTCVFRGDVFSAGPDRGGRGIGGPFWTDFSVLARARALPKGIIQIVGHSAARCKAAKSKSCQPIRARPDLAAIVVDAGLSVAYASNRAFLDIHHKNHIVAHTKGIAGKWRQQDLSQEYCQIEKSASPS